MAVEVPKDDSEAVLRAIRRIVRRISEHSRALSRQVGLTVPQLLVLKSIAQLEEESQREITVVMVGERVAIRGREVAIRG